MLISMHWTMYNCKFSCISSSPAELKTLIFPPPSSYRPSPPHQSRSSLWFVTWNFLWDSVLTSDPLLLASTIGHERHNICVRSWLDLLKSYLALPENICILVLYHWVLNHQPWEVSMIFLWVLPHVRPNSSKMKPKLYWVVICVYIYIFSVCVCR